MKKHRRFLAMGLICLSLLLSGCGTPLFELTADEEALIIKYAAHFVAKHNIYQKDGIINVVPEEFETETESADTNEPDGTDTSSEGETEKLPSITETVGMPKGISLVYVENYITNHVKEGVAYSVDAGEGFTYYVLKFQMKNGTSEPIEVDNASVHPTFKLTQDEIVTKSAVTFLSTDLSTYKGTIGAGESVDVILLFKVKEADAAKISTPTLEVIIDGEAKIVKL